METTAKCIICGGIKWIIFKDRCRCCDCNREHKWDVDAPPEQATKAQDIVYLVNDNY